jgi:hypothetical protein
MKITKVTFLPKNKKCLSLTIKVYYVNTDNYNDAEEKAKQKFKSECDNYSLYNVSLISSIGVI